MRVNRERRVSLTDRGVLKENFGVRPGRLSAKPIGNLPIATIGHIRNGNYYSKETKKDVSCWGIKDNERQE